MGTLSKDASFIKRFLNGDKGWAHSAQEFGVWASSVGLLGWLISPLIIIPIIIFLMLNADDYWREREVRQSLAQNRKGTAIDMSTVPDKPTNFWTQDAIDDVKHPRLMRKAWLVLSVIYGVWLYSQIGVYGVIKAIA